MSKKKTNPHSGSSLDDFLEEEGILEEATAKAAKKALAWQFTRAIYPRGTPRSPMARPSSASLPTWPLSPASPATTPWPSGRSPVNMDDCAVHVTAGKTGRSDRCQPSPRSALRRGPTSDGTRPTTSITARRAGMRPSIANRYASLIAMGPFERMAPTGRPDGGEASLVDEP